MKKWSFLDGILVVGVVLMALGVGLELRRRQGPVDELRFDEARDEIESKNIFIEMAGAVEKPGVYEMGAGARVNEALVEAGGLAASADREWVEKNLNRARLLRDGEKILIPKQGEVLGREIPRQARNDKININMASQAELEGLPGIGPALAGRIIEYRQTNNGFVNIEEIKLVSGIGEKVFSELEEKIKI